MASQHTYDCKRSRTGGKPMKLRSQILPGLRNYTTCRPPAYLSMLQQWTEHGKPRPASEQWESVFTLCYQTCVRIADIAVKNDSQVTHTQTPTANPVVGSSSNLCFHFSYATCSQLQESTVRGTPSSLEELCTDRKAPPFQLLENLPLCSVGWSWTLSSSSSG